MSTEVIVKGGKDENIGPGLDMIAAMQADLGAFIASQRAHGEKIEARHAAFEITLNRVEQDLRRMDDVLPAGSKSTAEIHGGDLHGAFIECARTMIAAVKVSQGRAHEVDRERYVADQSGETQGLGGAQVPVLVLPEIIRYQGHTSLPRRLFNPFPMQGRSIEFPLRASGPLVFWPNEGTSPWAVAPLGANQPPNPTAAPAGPAEGGFTAQGVKFADPSPVLVAKTVTAADKISGEYLQDAVSNEPLLAVIGRMYIEALSDEETRVALAGVGGVDPFTGIINTAGVQTASTVAAAGVPAPKDILGLIAKVHASVMYAPRSAFIVNTEAFIKKIMGMTDTGLVLPFVHNFAASIQTPYQNNSMPDPINAIPALLAGRPIYLTPHLPNGDATGEKWLIYGDMAGAWMGERAGVVMDYSPAPFWTANAMAIKASERIGFLYPQPGRFAVLGTT